MSECKEPHRRWLRFSLRSLLLLSLFLAVAVFWPVHKARQQRVAASALEQIGCSIHYDIEDRPLTFIERLRKLLGEPNFRNVVLVATRDSQVADRNAFHAQGVNPSVVLDCTDAGLVHLARLPELRNLDLSGAMVTDAGLINLEELTGLGMLNLSGTRVSDDGLKLLGGMKQLSALLLDRTQITDVGVAHLNGLTHLTWLGLGGTNLTDAGLAELQGMTQLTFLYLSGTRVTDTGLLYLGKLAHLECLFLQGTQVTEFGLRQLQEALPNLIVVH